MQNQVQYSQSNANPQLNANPVESTKQLNAQTQLTGDIIAQLPTDQTVPSHNEIRIVDTLFQKKKSIVDRILKNTIDVLIVGILFIVFSLPLVDNLIKKFINMAEKSEYILIGVKAILFMLSYFIVNNIYLIKKQSVNKKV